MSQLVVKTRFSHHRLDAYRLGLEVLTDIQRIAADVPRGYRRFADQLLRAGGSVVLPCLWRWGAEGANGRTKREKRNAFGIARREQARPEQSEG